MDRKDLTHKIELGDKIDLAIILHKEFDYMNEVSVLLRGVPMDMDEINCCLDTYNIYYKRHGIARQAKYYAIKETIDNFINSQFM
jgi:hypothetical protein